MLVQVRNPQHLRQAVWFFDQPEYFEYRGEEVKLKHVGADSLALSTGNPEWPVRVIPRSWIVTINGAVYAHTASQTLSKIVKGSKGEEYTVTMGARPTCTCTGFTFRKTCKHIL
jgi:hypothetical protein